MFPPLSAYEMRAALENPTEQAEFLRQLAANYRHIFASALVIVGNRDDAQDVFQEVCVILWQKYGEIERVENFRKWACTIAFNVSKSYVRKQRKYRGRGFGDAALAQVIQVRGAGSELLELRREILRECLQKLPASDRDFLSGCYDSSASLGHVAEQTGKTVSSVYSKLKRLRRILTECVQRRLSQGEDA